MGLVEGIRTCQEAVGQIMSLEAAKEEEGQIKL